MNLKIKKYNDENEGKDEYEDEDEDCGFAQNRNIVVMTQMLTCCNDFISLLGNYIQWFSEVFTTQS